MHVCWSAHMCIHHMCAVPTKARGGHQISENWNCRGEWVATWMLGTEPLSHLSRSKTSFIIPKALTHYLGILGCHLSSFSYYHFLACSARGLWECSSLEELGRFHESKEPLCPFLNSSRRKWKNVHIQLNASHLCLGFKQKLFISFLPLYF